MSDVENPLKLSSGLFEKVDIQRLLAKKELFKTL